MSALSIFKFREGGYEPGAEPIFRPFKCNRRRSRDYSFTPEHHAFIDDLGIVLSRPDEAGCIRLDDIFTYPDLQEQEVDARRRPIVRGEDLRQASVDARLTVITGPEQGGKTCLAKRLVRDLAASGFFPIYFDERTARLGFDMGKVKKRIEEQYSYPDAEGVIQAGAQKRVAILDDAFSRDPATIQRALTHPCVS